MEGLWNGAVERGCGWLWHLGAPGPKLRFVGFRVPGTANHLLGLSGPGLSSVCRWFVGGRNQVSLAFAVSSPTLAGAPKLRTQVVVIPAACAATRWHS